MEILLVLVGVVGVGYYVMTSPARTASNTAAMQLATLQTQRGQASVIGSYPASQPPSVATMNSLTVPIGVGVTVGAQAATGLISTFASAGSTAAKSLPLIGAAVAAFTAIWAAHAARLKGAQTENAAVPEVAGIFDQAIAQIAQSWNATHNQADCIAAVQQLDQSIYAYLKSRVGAAGTAWSDAVGKAGKCDKTCTVGCCIYWGNFHGGAVNGVLAGTVGMIQAIQRGGKTTVPMTKIYPGKYSTFTRPAYNVQLS